MEESTARTLLEEQEETYFLLTSNFTRLSLHFAGAEAAADLVSTRELITKRRDLTRVQGWT